MRTTMRVIIDAALCTLHALTELVLDLLPLAVVFYGIYAAACWFAA